MRKETEAETVTIVQTVHGMCVIVDRTALSQLSLQARIQPTFQHTPPATLPSVWESLLGEQAPLKLHSECIMGRTGAQRALT